jgi:energy-coupling factor transporter transmembrane protein EcfT
MLAGFFFSAKHGILSATMASIPILAYFGADVTGMVRATTGAMLAPFLLIILFLLSHRIKGTQYLSGMLLAGYFLTQPPTMVAFIVPFLFVLFSFFHYRSNKKESLKFFAPVIGILLLFGIPLIIGASFSYNTSILNLENAEWISPFLFDEKIQSLVGPVLRLSDYLLYLLTGLIGIIILGKKMENKKEIFHKKNRMPYFVLSGLFIMIITFGFSTFYYHYLSKIRYILYMSFLIPLVSFFLIFLVEKIKEKTLLSSNPSLWKRKEIILAILFILLAGPMNISSNNSIEKLNKNSWEGLEWINQNTEKNAKVLAIFGYYQKSYLLGGRSGTYVGESADFLNSLYTGKSAVFQEYCIPGFVRKALFTWIPAPCDNLNTKIQEYDYFIGDYSRTSREIGLTQWIEQEIKKTGYSEVFRNTDVVVYKKTGLLSTPKE